MRRSIRVHFALVMLVCVIVLPNSVFSQQSWYKHPGNPVLKVGAPGAHDSYQAHVSCVVKVGSEYWMYYYGSPTWSTNSKYIMLATSPDGVSWTKHGTGDEPLDFGISGYHEIMGICVLYDPTSSPHFRGWYAQAISSGYSPIDIFYATSDNGIDWDLHGVVLTRGTGWEDFRVQWPCVRKDDGIYHMWYQGHQMYAAGGVGHATSTDGINWTKDPANPVIAPEMNAPWVIRWDNTYYLYVGSPSGFLCATSEDGIIWDTSGFGTPILSPGPSGSWDAVSLETFAALVDDGVLKAWYSGYSGSVVETGYATGEEACPRRVWYLKPDGTGDAPTIQAAIDAACPGDTVLLACGTYTWASEGTGDGYGLITMKSGVHLKSETGDPGCVTIDAEQNGRVIFCHNVDSTATIEGLTIYRGRARGSVEQGYYYGGGLYCEYSSLNIRNCDFISNIGEHSGGGICADFSSTPAITGCSFISNNLGYAASHGGGLFCHRGAAVEIVDCVFRGNQGDGGGGVCFAATAESSIVENCLFSGNDARGGGGVNAAGAVLQIAGCTFSGNEASLIGGGISALSSVLVDNTIIWGNCSTGSGDEVNLEPASIVTFRCCDVDDSGIDGSGTVVWDTGNIHTDPMFCDPLDCTSAPTTAGDYHLAQNSPCADAPGCGQIGALGVGCYPPSVPTVWYIKPDSTGDAPTIQAGIDSASFGDTVLVAAGTYTETCQSTAHGPSMIVLKSGVTLISEDGPTSTILDGQNSCRVIYCNSVDSTASIIGFTITRGRVGGPNIYGAGIGCWSSSPKILDCVVSDNESADSGGGLGCWESSPTVTDCSFIGNVTTESHGGGLYCAMNSNATISNCIISGNRCKLSGGGMAFSGDSALTIVGCVFSGNQTTYHLGGGGGLNGEGRATITGCTFSGNRATSVGGAIAYNLGPVSVSNTIVWGNCAAGDGDEIWLVPGSSVTFRCSDVDTSGIDGPGTVTWDTGNIHTDPLFCDPLDCASAPTTAGDYHLNLCSPCAYALGCGLIGALGIGCDSPTVWYVKPDGTGDAPTIQAAVDLACPGDTVLVAPGTYTEPCQSTAHGPSMIILKSGITLISEAGPEATILDAQESCRVIYGNSVDETSVIGFTITRGHASGPNIFGAGIGCWFSSLTVEDCILTDNRVAASGGGLGCWECPEMVVDNCMFTLNQADAGHGGGLYLAHYSSGSISGCSFSANSCFHSGAGLNLSESWAIVEDCVFTGNKGTGHPSGGAISCYYSAGTRVVNCTVSGNVSEYGGGVSLSVEGALEMENCILWGNCGTISGDEVYLPYVSSSVAFACCDVDSTDIAGPGSVTWLDGNIDEDPLFCDPMGCTAAPTTSGDYHLYSHSPCLPDDQPLCGLIGALGAACQAPGAIAGTVSADTLLLGGATVDLLDSGGILVDSYITDLGAGTFAFEGLTPGDYSVELVLPLGYKAVEGYPLMVAATVVPLDTTLVEFRLEPIVTDADARSKGYWKHQYKVYDSGKGTAQVSVADLEAFQQEIYNHFYYRPDEYAIRIEGVTHSGGGVLMWEDALTTLSAQGADGIDMIAYSQFLALLLNVVSQKIGQYHEVTADGMTLSQAITYVADLLSDTDTSNDELAKDIAEQVNENHEIAAGTIPTSTPVISYQQKHKLKGGITLDARPNPAAEGVELSYSLPSAGGRVLMEIYDLSGRLVRRLSDGPQDAGYHRVIWRGDDETGRPVAPGVYFYRLDVDGKAQTLKVVMLR